MFPRLFLWTLALVLPGCGGPELWHRAVSEATAMAPEAGGEFSATMASLFEPPPGKGHKLEVLELRVLAMNELPWVPLEAGSEATRRGRVGLTIHRICRFREGLAVERAERSSWMIFEDGRLVAWDHGNFAAGCIGGRSYRPARAEWLDLERGLLRYSAQRYPTARPTLEERLRGGLALLDAERLDDAKRALGQAEHNVTALSDHTETLFGEERAAAEERLVIVKALHVKLRRAVRQAEREAAGETTGSGNTQP